MEINNNIFDNYNLYNNASNNLKVPASNVKSSENSLITDSNDPLVKQLKETGKIECQTCSERRYVDGSDDPGVSFKTPSNISPEASMALVSAHEQEHVANEQADAKAEGKRVVAQSVTLHSDICPECGKVYISGGVTSTTTKTDSKEKDFFLENMKNFMIENFGVIVDEKA